jgi:hypothetical protein
MARAGLFDLVELRFTSRPPQPVQGPHEWLGCAERKEGKTRRVSDRVADGRLPYAVESVGEVGAGAEVFVNDERDLYGGIIVDDHRAAEEPSSAE